MKTGLLCTPSLEWSKNVRQQTVDSKWHHNKKQKLTWDPEITAPNIWINLSWLSASSTARWKHSTVGTVPPRSHHLIHISLHLHSPSTSAYSFSSHYCTPFSITLQYNTVRKFITCTCSQALSMNCKSDNEKLRTLLLASVIGRLACNKCCIHQYSVLFSLCLYLCNYNGRGNWP